MPSQSGRLRTPQTASIFQRLVRIGHRLIAGKHVGQAAHVAGPLDIVLAPEGIDPAAPDAHVAAEHGQVGQGFDVVRAGGVLGDAHGINDGGGFGRPRRVGRRWPGPRPGTPLSCSTYSGVYRATVSFSAAKFSVRSAI